MPKTNDFTNLTPNPTEQSEIEAAQVIENSQDPIFVEEQNHLTVIYDKLQTIGETAAKKLQKIAEAAAADKIAMAGELSHNTATADDILEMQADFSAANRIIDAYNLSHDLEAQRLTTVELLLREPYFAKISLELVERPGKPVRDIYIGNAGISDENYKSLVVDWRSPVAEVYYNQDNGPTSYKVENRTINANLLVRRQFSIEKNILHNYFDTTVAIQDSLLLASLSRKRSAKMQAITATIQKEQNRVVRHEDTPTLLVAGIAGSGKTSVLLQRIAYLFYQQRHTLSPEDVVLITPNAVFERYISGVLPDLGESNPITLTWASFAKATLPDGYGVGNVNTDLDALIRLDNLTANFVFQPSDFKTITWGRHKLIGADQLYRLSQKWPNVTSPAHLVSLMHDEVMARLEGRIKGLSYDEEVQARVYDLPVQEQIRLFGEAINPHDEDEERALALTYLTDQCKTIFEEASQNRWVDIDAIARRLINPGGAASLEWMYLYMLITGASQRNVRYVFIDEVQDYTEAQLYILSRYYPCAHFLLLGDPSQAILENTATFPKIKALFEKVHGPLAYEQLTTSYRSTPQITQLFAPLADSELAMEISSVQREDTTPEIIECADEASYQAALRDALKKAEDTEGLCAIIVPWKQEAKRLIKMLGDDAPPLLDDSSKLPDSGTVMMTLKLAKGLEFDRVIIANANEHFFGTDDLSRHRLYTAISRATRDICILSQGPLTPLLRK